MTPITSGMPVDDHRIITGGYDKTLKIWQISTSDRKPVLTKVHSLIIEHNAAVSALAWRPSDNTLLSASSTKLWTCAISRETVSKPVELSNKPHNIHIHPTNPNVVMLEVSFSLASRMLSSY